MIRYLGHDKINKLKWDDCISNSGNLLIYAYSWYLDAVSPFWEALVEDDYLSVFPLTCKKRFGINYLTQPYFSQQLGIFSSITPSPEKIKNFIQAIPKKFIRIDIHLNAANESGAYFFRVSKRINYQLNLSRLYEEIRKHYSGNTKRNLKRSARYLLMIQSVSIEHIISLYRKFISPRVKNEWLNNFQLNKLRVLVDELSLRNKIHLLGCFDSENRLNACGAFIESDHRVIFLMGGANSLGRTSGAMRHLVDHIIHQFSGSDFIFDFEGSQVPSVAMVYAGFGATIKEYPELCYTRYGTLTLLLPAYFFLKKQFARIHKTISIHISKPNKTTNHEKNYQRSAAGRYSLPATSFLSSAEHI